MKLAAYIGTAQRDWEDLRSFAIEAERIGVDSIWAAEFAGHDAFTPLAFIAGQTNRIRLGTGVLTLGARSAANTAMTAVSLASMSGGRFMLGLGANSPEFLAGFHGRPFPPASRHLRETIEVIRLVAAGRPLEYTGTVASFPSDGIPAVEMEPGLAQSFPIYIASLSPKSLQVTGAVADGWVGGASFAPSMAGLFREHIDRGAAGEGRSLATFDFMAPAFMPPDRERGLAIVKPFLASQLGRQGAFTYGFHPRVYLRAGMEGLVERITSLFAAGKPGEAAAQVPDELALERCLVGSDDDMRTTLRAYRDCGATTIETFAFRPKLIDSLEQLARVKALLDEVNAEEAVPAVGRSS